MRWDTLCMYVKYETLFSDLDYVPSEGLSLILSLIKMRPQSFFHILHVVEVKRFNCRAKVKFWVVFAVCPRPLILLLAQKYAIFIASGVCRTLMR